MPGRLPQSSVTRGSIRHSCRTPAPTMPVAPKRTTFTRLPSPHLLAVDSRGGGRIVAVGAPLPRRDSVVSGALRNSTALMNSVSEPPMSSCVMKFAVRSGVDDLFEPGARVASVFAGQLLVPELRHRHQRNSFLMTFPPFITNLTRWSSVMSASGSPDTAIRSAYLPLSMDPI